MADLTPGDPRLEQLKRRWEVDKTSRVFVQLAEEYRRAGALDKALAVVDEGLERHADYLPGRLVKGRCLLESNLLDEAGEVLEAVVERDPTNLVATRLLTECAVDRGEPERARELLERCRMLGVPEDELLTLEGRLQPASEMSSMLAPAGSEAATGAASQAEDPTSLAMTTTGTVIALPATALPPIVLGAARERVRSVKGGHRSEPFGRAAGMPVGPVGEAEAEIFGFALPVVTTEGPSGPAEMFQGGGRLALADAEPGAEPEPLEPVGLALVEGVSEAESAPESAPEGAEGPGAEEVADPSEVDKAPMVLVNAQTAEALVDLGVEEVESVAEPEAIIEAEESKQAEYAQKAEHAQEAEQITGVGDPHEVPDLAVGEATDDLAVAPEAPVEDERPLAAGASVTLGKLYLRQGHLVEAEAQYAAVLEQDPSDEEARVGLETVRLRRQKPVTADELLADVKSTTGLTSRKIAVLERYLEILREGARRYVS